jgi:hypothetical protein
MKDKATIVTRKTLHAIADKQGYIRKAGQVGPKLRITEDGTIYRADTDLTLCRAMTLREAAKVLG